MRPVINIAFLEPAPKGDDPYEREVPDQELPGPVDEERVEDHYEVDRLASRPFALVGYSIISPIAPCVLFARTTSLLQAFVSQY